MPCHVVLTRPEQVVSDINPFFVFEGSATACPAADAAEAPVVFLDFFPIFPELSSLDEFCTEAKIDVTKRDDNENPIWESYIDQSVLRD